MDGAIIFFVSIGWIVLHLFLLKETKETLNYGWPVGIRIQGPLTNRIYTVHCLWDYDAPNIHQCAHRYLLAVTCVYLFTNSPHSLIVNHVM